MGRLVLLAALLATALAEAAPRGSLRRLVDDLVRGARGLDVPVRLELVVEGPDGKAQAPNRRFDAAVRGLMEGRLPRGVSPTAATTLSIAFVVTPAGKRCEPQKPCPAAQLDAFAELREGRRAFWDELVLPSPGIRTAWFARARIDPELRAFLGLSHRALGPLGLRVVPLDEPSRGAVAVATLDLDGDHDQEFVVLGSELRVYRWLHGTRPVRVASHPFPRSGRPPLRLPFGAAFGLDLDGDGDEELVAWTSEQEAAPCFGWAGGGLERLNTRVARCPGETAPGPMSACGAPLAVWAADSRTSLVTGNYGADRATLTGELSLFSAMPGAAESPGRPGFSPPPRTVAWTAAQLYAGERWDRTVASVDASGTLVAVRVGSAEVHTDLEAGSALALVDLGDDGVLEVVRSGYGTPSAPDVVVVSAIEPGRPRLIEKARLPAALVRGFAPGDADNDGRSDVLVLTAAGLHWLGEVEEGGAERARP